MPRNNKKWIKRLLFSFDSDTKYSLRKNSNNCKNENKNKPFYVI